MLRLWLLFLLLIPKTLSDETKERFREEDIPVVEGDGGTVKIRVEEDVLVLNEDNFDIIVNSKDIILVEFYAPWCVHCQALEPHYAKAAGILKNKTPRIPLGKVDATEQRALVDRFQVDSYPTLFVYRKGVQSSYEGPRSAEGIAEYMLKIADPKWKPPPDVVVNLGKDNFTEFIEEHDISLMLFYAPWCNLCKKLLPDYERAAKQLKKNDPPVPFGRLNIFEHREVYESQGVRGFPTLVIYRNGRKYEYDGPKEDLAMVEYMKMQAQPPSNLVKNIKELDKSSSSLDATVVGVFKNKNSRNYVEFTYAANELRTKHVFLHCFSGQLAKHFGIKNEGIVLFHPESLQSKFESKYNTLTKDVMQVQEIRKFIKKYQRPLVGYRTRANFWKYQEAYPMVVVYYDVNFTFDHRVETQLKRSQVLQVAKDYPKVTFVISHEQEFEDELKQLALDDSGEEVGVGYFDSPSERYRMEPVEDFEADELRSFVEGVLSGKIKRYRRSSPPPVKQTHPVITVVGTTFEELVTNSTKDVLIEFYAPWCEHCKKFQPIFDKVAEAMKDNKNLVIAKIDGSVNDYPGIYFVEGYPVIYFLSASDKNNPLKFDKERTFDNLMKFLRDNMNVFLTEEERKGIPKKSKEEAQPPAEEKPITEAPSGSEVPLSETVKEEL